MSDVLKITLLGTGTPLPNINAFGTSTLIEAGGKRLLLDCGRGTVIRLRQMGVPLGDIDTVFLSHYHCDHYTDLLDLVTIGAVPHPFAGRKGPIHVHGPVGLEHITIGAWEMSKPDRDIRSAEAEVDPEHVRLIPHVYFEGVVYDKDGLVVKAILVDHGEKVTPAFAFRVEYGGHVFVHSHDTKYNKNLIDQSKGADVMIHEIAAARPEVMKSNKAVRTAVSHHTTPAEVGKVFKQVKPKLGFVTHIVQLPPEPLSIEEMMMELGEVYSGTVMAAEDLTTIIISNSISVIPFNSGVRL
ncbi:MBL fold metallo-hydrolase [uncultured Ruegeria sp.]|uniref:MBL fold metallo-hydrolase n=1 Tax=uncultured Ruegeria sp. TaxID=259304 RepID=UPI00260529CA|nr:MBL fold metallo-hydrolase [uncultured Ruegeria sp.]